MKTYRNKYNKNKNNRSKKGGEYKESLIVTIAIITHGCIFNLNPQQYNYDVRYYSAVGSDINTCDGSIKKRSDDYYNLIKYFRQNKPSGENESINEIPYYYDDIPYDKIIGVSRNQGIIADCMDNISSVVTGHTATGIWLVSVHKEKINLNNYKKTYEYLYPTNKNMHINLLSISGLEYFNKIIGKNYVDIRDELYKNNKKLPDKKSDMINLDNWNVQLDNNKDRIKLIRSSYFFDLIKSMVDNVKINIYDYSCSIMCNDCNFDQQVNQGLIKNIEDGKSPFFTGGKSKKRTRKKYHKKYHKK